MLTLHKVLRGKSMGRRRSGHAQLFELDPLESRTLLSVVYFGAASGDWHTNGKWALLQRPFALDTAAFNTTVTVTLSQDETVDFLRVDSHSPTIDLNGHTLTVSSGVQVDGGSLTVVNNSTVAGLLSTSTLLIASATGETAAMTIDGGTTTVTVSGSGATASVGTGTSANGTLTTGNFAVFNAPDLSIGQPSGGGTAGVGHLLIINESYANVSGNLDIFSESYAEVGDLSLVWITASMFIGETGHSSQLSLNGDIIAPTTYLSYGSIIGYGRLFGNLVSSTSGKIEPTLDGHWEVLGDLSASDYRFESNIWSDGLSNATVVTGDATVSGVLGNSLITQIDATALVADQRFVILVGHTLSVTFSDYTLGDDITVGLPGLDTGLAWKLEKVAVTIDLVDGGYTMDAGDDWALVMTVVAVP